MRLTTGKRKKGRDDTGSAEPLEEITEENAMQNEMQYLLDALIVLRTELLTTRDVVDVTERIASIKDCIVRLVEQAQ